jgi:hypothetical protein
LSFAEEQQDALTYGFFDLDGYYRLRGISTEGFAIDDNDVIDSNSAWTNRLRLEPVLTFGEFFKFQFQGDFLDGTLSQEIDDVTIPTGSPNGGNFEDSDFRRAWFDLRTPIGLIRGGRAPSHWGMGILANSGDGFDDDFGDNQFGNTSDRFLIATRPLGQEVPWNVIAAFDRVVEDPLATTDDDAFNFIFANLYQTKPVTAGTYIVRRTQSIEGKDLNAWGFDAYANLNYEIDEEQSLFAQGEGVYIVGTTDLAVDKLHNPPFEGEIRQAGLVGRGGYKNLWSQIATEVGWASGDSDVLDNEITAFSFNPDYNVGLILFEQLLASLSEKSASNAEDPLLRAVPSDGHTLIPTDGSATNAFYVNPTLKFWPSEGWETIVGLLYAQAPQELIDPFQTGLAGGIPTNHYGGIPDESLGIEFDGGLSYSQIAESLGDLKFTGGVQGGYFLPGDAFNDAAGNGLDDLWTVQGRLTLQW